MKKKILLAILTCFLSACYNFSILTSGVVSTKEIKVSDINLNEKPQMKNVRGTSERWMVLFIPIGIPSIAEAVDDALYVGNGDLMIDTTIENNIYWFVLFGKNTIEARGTVVNTCGGKE